MATASAAAKHHSSQTDQSPERGRAATSSRPAVLANLLKQVSDPTRLQIILCWLKARSMSGPWVSI